METLDFHMRRMNNKLHSMGRGNTNLTCSCKQNYETFRHSHENNVH